MILTSRIRPTREGTTATSSRSPSTGGSGGRALTTEQTITVTVTDENEPPRFTSVDTFTVTENVLLAARMAAEDVDRDDGITGYDVTGGRRQ